ncbi:MAG TPA: M17 family peptidase N-terminal domain-containing protein, partial [Planctomycetaceae bacterium]|nr:M17 family peptidase N-terminal domain-containing protein [Planctomycetaceae bacterium]
MEVGLARTPWTQTAADWLVVPLTDPVEWSPPLKQLDQALGGVLARLDAAGELPTKVGATLQLRGLTGIAAPRLLLVGWGPAGAKPQVLDRGWMTAWRSIADKPNLRVAALIPPRIAGGPPAAALVQTAVTAAHVGSYGQDL